MIKQSSGKADVDKATIEAVNKSEPFDVLPSDYKQNTVDIQFEFNYNFLNKK